MPKGMIPPILPLYFNSEKLPENPVESYVAWGGSTGTAITK